MTTKKLKSIDIINVLSDLVSEKMETTVKLPLEDEISHILFKDYETFQLGIPYDKGEDFKYLYENTYVEQVDYRDDYIYLQIEAKRQDIKDYLKYLLLN